MCRVGGEVEESIIQGYSNKYHDGFLGHAYVGEWVNLGALTTNSDLKNDYSTVSVVLDGKTPIDTGSTKVGSLIGDHTKTSIGTLLNTGAYVGAMAVIAATGKPLPKFIPSFAWFLEGVVTKGFGKKALYETARMAMGRRKCQLDRRGRGNVEHRLRADRARPARGRQTGPPRAGGRSGGKLKVKGLGSARRSSPFAPRKATIRHLREHYILISRRFLRCKRLKNVSRRLPARVAGRCQGTEARGPVHGGLGCGEHPVRRVDGEFRRGIRHRNGRGLALSVQTIGDAAKFITEVCKQQGVQV